MKLTLNEHLIETFRNFLAFKLSEFKILDFFILSSTQQLREFKDFFKKNLHIKHQLTLALGTFHVLLIFSTSVSVKATICGVGSELAFVDDTFLWIAFPIFIYLLFIIRHNNSNYFIFYDFIFLFRIFHLTH